ncbi:hypothetical protein GJ496_001760 [Pomphorhynchus laevis]|nr:hypothetical protein GJ496_001760 [Pomphorhynchus laevis]
MVFRVKKILADGSKLIDNSSSSSVSDKALRIGSCNLCTTYQHQNFTVFELNSSDIFEGSCAYLSEGYSFLGVLGLPQKWEKTDVIYFYIVLDTDRTHIGLLRGYDIFRINEVILIPVDELLNSSDDVINEVRKFLGSGCIFYSKPNCFSQSFKDFDLTQNTQDMYNVNGSQKDFFWNRSWCIPLTRSNIDVNKWVSKLICGSVETFSININYRLSVWVISRMSSAYTGTRFSARGLNDYGHTANFVESEQILIKENNVKNDKFNIKNTLESSYVILRGSVPLFWSQSSVQVGKHRIHIKRSPALTSRAFLLHFMRLSIKYGKILPLSLVSDKGGESVLNRFYGDMIMHFLNTPTEQTFCRSARGKLMHRTWSLSDDCQVPRLFIHFDYHEHAKSVKNMSSISFVTNYLLRHHECLPIDKFIQSNGQFLSRNGKPILEQTGSIRVNCIDCLDRTNSVQAGISYLVFNTYQLPALFHDSNTQLPSSLVENIQARQHECWVKNGDAISRIYAGTGALSGKSKAGDMKRSITRVLQNSLFDSTKNSVIESLILSYAKSALFGKNITYHLNHKLVFGEENVIRGLSNYTSRFLSKRPLRISISTWNINGDKDKATETNRFDLSGQTATLNSWLISGPNELLAQKLDSSCPIRTTGHVDSSFENKPIDIYVIGFQEICDITASSVVKASQQNMQRWQEMLKSLINNDNDRSHSKSKIEYVLVTKDQMVGVCLFVFIRRELACHIRHLHTAKVKTGFLNSVGNKGCVATRFCIYSTSMCFICAHFNAGQKEIELRNEDHHSIIQKLTTAFKLPVLEHDYVFFFGDFNYRINLPRKEVIDLVSVRNYLTLLSADQLNIEKSAGKIFNGFVEGPIIFDPTYKYDYHCQIFDTSEKARIPSWCDRILWRRHKRSINYFGNKNCATAGDLQYYGRAELMTSDHRPVTAVIDIESVQTDESNLIDCYIESRNHNTHSVVLLETNSSVPKRVYDCIVNDLNANLKDHFIIPRKDRTTIVLFFIYPEHARRFVDYGEAFWQCNQSFTKRLHSTSNDKRFALMEQLLLFGKKNEQEDILPDDTLNSISTDDERSELVENILRFEDEINSSSSDNEYDNCNDADVLLSSATTLTDTTSAKSLSVTVDAANNVAKGPWDTDFSIRLRQPNSQIDRYDRKYSSSESSNAQRQTETNRDDNMHLSTSDIVRLIPARDAPSPKATIATAKVGVTNSQSQQKSDSSALSFVKEMNNDLITCSNDIHSSSQDLFDIHNDRGLATAGSSSKTPASLPNNSRDSNNPKFYISSDNRREVNKQPISTGELINLDIDLLNLSDSSTDEPNI